MTEEIMMENTSEEEQIGFHKGALSTLVKEREEFLKTLAIVEQLMKIHIKALKEKGIDLEAQAKQTKKKPASSNKNKGKNDDLI